MSYCHCCKSYKDDEDEVATSIYYNTHEKVYYCCAGYGSCFDTEKFLFTKDFKNEEELRNHFPWLSSVTDISDDILCDDCLHTLIFNKEIYIEDRFEFGEFMYPFYTTCCDNFVEKSSKSNPGEPFFSSDVNITRYYAFTKRKYYPYASEWEIFKESNTYKYPNGDYSRYWREDETSVNLLKNIKIKTIIFCSHCLVKYKQYLKEKGNNDYHDYDYYQRTKIVNEFISNSRKNIKKKQKRKQKFIFQTEETEETYDNCSIVPLSILEKHLAVKEELKIKLFKRNLEIITQLPKYQLPKYQLPKDIKEYLLKFV